MANFHLCGHWGLQLAIYEQWFVFVISLCNRQTGSISVEPCTGKKKYKFSQVLSCIKIDCGMTPKPKSNIYLNNLAWFKLVWAQGTVWVFVPHTDQSVARGVLSLSSLFQIQKHLLLKKKKRNVWVSPWWVVMANKLLLLISDLLNHIF